METANAVDIASFIVPLVFNFLSTFKRLKFKYSNSKAKRNYHTS